MLLAPEQAELMNLNAPIKPYRNGKDLTDKPRNLFVIDCYGLTEEEVKTKYPALYQHLLIHVKPERDANRDKDLREKWWLHRRNNEDMRKSLSGLTRYIGTVMTAKHRVFQFLDGTILPDQMVVAISLNSGFYLGILSSFAHVAWAIAAGGRLGVGNDPRYLKGRCFEPFPFPSAASEHKEKIHALSEQLDSHRKRQQTQHASLTLTGMYNVLEKLKTGEALNEKEKIIHEQGLVSVLKQLHDELDLAVLAAYGWSESAPLMEVINGNLPAQRISATATRDDIKRELEETLLEKLVALNCERAEDEKKGIVHWLRPEYQNPQGAVAANTIDEQTELVMDEETDAPIVINMEKQPWPKGDLEQVKAVADLIAASKSPMNLESVAACFSGKGQWKKRLPNILDMLVVGGKARVDERGCVAV